MAHVADDAADQLGAAGGHVGHRRQQPERHHHGRRGQRAGGGRGRGALVGQHLGVALGRVVRLAGQGVPLVVEAHHLGAEVDVEGLLGLAAHVEPAQHRRLQDLQRVGGGRHPAARGRHLHLAAGPHEGVADEGGRAGAVDGLHDLLAHGVRRPGAGVVDPARLEVDALDRPAHRPVDLPDQLALVVGAQVGDALEAAGGAGVGEVGALVVVGRRGRRVTSALAAVGLVGEPGQVPGAVGCVAGARGLVVLDDGVGQRGRLLLGLRDRGGLGAVAAQDGLDAVAVRHGLQHLLDVVAAAVGLGLGDLLHLHAHGVEAGDQRLLEVLGPRGVALPRVGHRGERAADVVGPGRVDAGGHLAEAVVVVPAVQVAHRQPAPADLLGHEVHGQELAQVAQVDRARRAGAGGAGDGAALRADRLLAAGVADRVVRGPGDPVGGAGAVGPVGTACVAASCHGVGSSCVVGAVARQRYRRRGVVPQRAPGPSPVAAPAPPARWSEQRHPPMS